MKKMIRERLEIAKVVACAAIQVVDGDMEIDKPDEVSGNLAVFAWSVADSMCRYAEEMWADEAAAEKAELEKARRKLEEEQANQCILPVADGFQGPCINARHGKDEACLNGFGDQW